MFFLDLLTALLLALIYGITIWLPVSPEGHILLVNRFVKFQEVSDTFFVMFIAMMELGVLAAFILFSWRKLNIFTKTPGHMIQLKTSKLKLWAKILIPTIPVFIFQLIFNHSVSDFTLKPMPLAFEFIVIGLLFIIIEHLNSGKRPSITKFKQLKISPVLFLVGIVEMISVVLPGHSRLSLVLIIGLFIGMSRAVAVEYAYYLAIPTLFVSAMIRISSVIPTSFTAAEVTLLIFGALISFAVAFVSIKVMLKLSQRYKLSVFGIYRILIGIAIITVFKILN